MHTRALAGVAQRQRGRWRLLLAAVLSGGVACAALLAGLGGLAQPALAAPEAPATARTYPGAAPCNTSLQACIDGSSAGDSIAIQPNTYITSVTLDKAVSLTGVSSATVILQALPGQRVLTVTGAAVNASVVISGLTFQGGNVSGAGCPAGCGGAILITATASPVLHNVTISNSVAQFQGGGLYANVGSAVQLNGVSVISNTSGSDGGGVRAGGAVTVLGGLYYSNRCIGVACGAGALLAVGALNVSGARFISNTTEGGAGVYAAAAATFSGGSFQDNRCLEAACTGAALYTNAGLVMSGTQFLSNTSRFHGGALYGDNQPAHLTNVVFRNNQCTETTCSGGAAWAPALVLTGTQFISNSSQSNGGAAIAYQTITALNSLAQDNRCMAANCHGGGLSTQSGLTLINSLVLSNTAGDDGGALYTEGPALLSGGLLQNNRCTGTDCRGGGLWAAGGLNLNGTQVISNSSEFDGGGIRAGGGPVTLAGGLFQRNHCNQGSCGAGGLYAGGALSLNGTQFISNTSQAGASGLYAPLAATVTGGLFQENRCFEDACEGAGLYANSTLVLTGTQFLSNTARRQGGALYANVATTLTAALFYNNACTAVDCAGGAIFAEDTLTLRDSQVTSNSATASGGGWLVSKAVVVSDSQVANNTAGAQGGGGYAHAATIVESVFQDNRCTLSSCNGGGLLVENDAMLTGAQFLSNTSGFDGGGLFANGPVTLTDSLFLGNACTTAFCFAGGVLANGAATVSGARFINNSSQSHGGGLYVAGALNVSASEFRGNQSGQGGGLHHNGAGGQIVNTLFAGNTARGGHGAALSSENTGPLSLVHNTLVSATLGGGSAVYVVTQTVRLTNTLVAGYAVGLELAGGNLNEDYTLFAGVPTPYSGAISAGAHSFTGTAAFVSAAGGDFHLTGASDALNAGVEAGVLVDFDGQPRPFGSAPDIGYDELYNRLYLPLILR